MVKGLTKKERLKKNLLKIGEVAKMVGILRSCVDYYADIGLLKVADYTQGKYRLFKKNEVLARMEKIKELKDKGLTLNEIIKEGIVN
jgi:DNA-binding transcriptional MerR regulator